MNPIEKQQPWKKAKLSEIATIERVSVQPGGIGNGTRYVGLEHVSSEGALLNPPTVNRGDLASSKFTFGPDHILYGKLRPYLSKIARPDFTGVCSTDILPIRPGPAIDRGYLYYFLRQPELVQLATSRCSGANLPRLNPAILSNFQIYFPPLEEQRRIAVILDQADALRRKRRESLALTSSLIPSIFHSMFGDPGSNPKSWPVLSVSALFSKERGGARCGPFGSALKKQEYKPHGIPVWQIDNVMPNSFVEPGCLFIDENKYTQLEAYRVTNGDILVSRAGTVGRMCVAEPTAQRSIIGTNLIRLSLESERIHPLYFTSLCSYFPERILRLRADGDPGSYSFLNTTALASLKLPCPPLSLQRAFAARVGEVRALEAKQRASLLHLDSLFHSLLHRAFNGELA